MIRGRRILVVTPDRIGPEMAGMAIRAWHIARDLAVEHEVVLATTASAAHPGGEVDVVVADSQSLHGLVDWADVVVVQGWVLARNPFIVRSEKIVVVDAYDPMHLEALEQSKDRDSKSRRAAVREVTGVVNQQLVRADLVLCASERQRQLWVGAMGALGRLSPELYDEDPTMGRRVAVVPFGVPPEPPVRTGPGVRGVVPGISARDHLLLWGGGIYNWFDPLTLLQAIARLRTTAPTIRLLFLGTTHPNPDVPEMRMAQEARVLADQLGLTGTHVFFNAGWVPYGERHNYLLDADVGVTTHLLHLETEFSYRTRVLDFLWAGLPVVTTGGDAIADLVRSRQIGLTVPPGDVDALSAALSRVLTDDGFATNCRANAREVASEFHWAKVLAPLSDFCRDPSRAPDLVSEAAVRELRRGPPVGLGPDGLAGLPRRIRGKLARLSRRSPQP